MFNKYLTTLFFLFVTLVNLFMFIFALLYKEDFKENSQVIYGFSLIVMTSLCFFWFLIESDEGE